MTLTDKEPTPQEPSRKQSTFSRHFEVGPDGVEEIVRGEALVPPSERWIQMFENRMNPPVNDTGLWGQ